MNIKIDKMNQSVEKIENHQNQSIQHIFDRLDENIPDTLFEFGKEKFAEARKLYTDAILHRKTTVYSSKEGRRMLWDYMEKFPYEYFGVGKAKKSEYFTIGPENTILEQKTAEFIKKGGKLTRVLYLMDDIPLSEAKQIIRKQLNMGVIVYTIDFNDVPPKDRNKYFALGGDYVYAAIGGSNNTNEILVSNNPETVEYYEKFKELLMKRGKREK